MTLNKQLLDILACPVCKGGVVVTGAQEGLICERCAKVYPIRDEIPVMLAYEAISRAEWEKGKRENSSTTRDSIDA